MKLQLPFYNSSPFHILTPFTLSSLPSSLPPLALKAHPLSSMRFRPRLRVARAVRRIARGRRRRRHARAEARVGEDGDPVGPRPSGVDGRWEVTRAAKQRLCGREGEEHEKTADTLIE